MLGTFNEILSSKLLASEEDKERASPESRTRGESTPVQLVNAVGSAASRESGTRAKIEGSYSQLLKVRVPTRLVTRRWICHASLKQLKRSSSQLKNYGSRNGKSRLEKRAPSV